MQCVEDSGTVEDSDTVDDWLLPCSACPLVICTGICNEQHYRTLLMSCSGWLLSAVLSPEHEAVYLNSYWV